MESFPILLPVEMKHGLGGGLDMTYFQSRPVIGTGGRDLDIFFGWGSISQLITVIVLKFFLFTQSLSVLPIPTKKL